MNEFLTLAFLFFVGCLMGWVLEVFFRRFNPANISRRWINPGFLNGPYLPLYGCGLCGLYLLASLEQFLPIDNVMVRKLVLFVLMAICMTLIEYITGLIFIKRMHVKLWDYSNNWMNIQGIICPLFSFFWAVLGAVYYFLIHPYILDALEWFSRNLTFSFVIGMFYGIFLLDVCYSFKLVAKIKQFAVENHVLIRYENLKDHIRQQAEEQKTKYRFLFAFHSATPLNEQLKNYLEKQKKKLLSKKADEKSANQE